MNGTNLAHYWKAILGFVVPGVVTLGSAITSGSDGGSTITATEWLTAAFACVLTAGAVAAKANAPEVAGPQPDQFAAGDPNDAPAL